MLFKSGGEFRGKSTKLPHKQFALHPTARYVKAIMFASFASVAANTATAQETPQTSQAQETNQAIEVIDVVGTRKVIQDQIAIKRESTTIVDGLSAEDIGDLPALSIGEALENLTGASSHRENGGATEISIRGLGPFLSATHINGRQATNGSGDRSVNFSQFPSELVKKVAIYKTQDASMIEGGVAGVITLETLKPLDFGKQRFQAEVKLNHNPDESNVENSLHDDLGFRGTVSYVDQFEFDNGQSLGVSVGVQRQDISQPEAEYRSSSPSGSSLWACLFDPANTNEGFFRSSGGDCEDQISGNNNVGYETQIDPETGRAVDDGQRYAWTGSSRSFRQNETSDERDAFFFGVQYRPTDRLDINIDAQVSERVQNEARHDLIMLQKRATPGITGNTLVTNSVGGILHWEGFDRVESAGEQFERAEDYLGYGLNIVYFATDSLKVAFDLGYSETKREELQISNRGRTGSPGSNLSPFFSWDLGSEIPHFTFTNFDVTDISNFSNDLRTRVDRENVRDNDVLGAKLDFEYTLESEVFSVLKAGIRTSEMNYIQFGGNQGNGSRTEATLGSLVDAADVFGLCQIDFPESSFLSSVSDGNIITNVDADGNVLQNGTGNAWATYDNVCFSKALFASTNGDFAYPDVFYESTGTIDVTEKTNALYVMTEFDTDIGGYFIRGNFGVRVVDTEVTSRGFRGAFDIVADEETGALEIVESSDGILEQVQGGGSYTEVLPSANLVVDYSDDILLRAGVYRGMSRVNPSDLSFNRTFQEDTSGEAFTVADLLVGANGSGNPNAKPLMSWNFDIGVEWYPNEDAIFALGFYYKQFQGGFENRTVLETFDVGNEIVTLPITNQTTVDEASDLFGLEATVAYRWDSGFGIKLGYNYADSNFKFNDSLYGDTFTTDLDGNTTQLTAGIIPAGSVPGLSENVFSGQIYYQIGELDAALIYKYRDSYFQPYVSNGTRLRFVDDVGVFEARISYRINKNVRVRLEAINLFSEPRSDDFFVQGNLGSVSDYGPRLFAGVSFKY